MNRNWKLFNYLITAILSLAAILTIFCVWSPYLINTDATFPDSGLEVPMRVVGVNMSHVMLLGVCLVIAVSIVFLSVKRKKIPTGLLWVNGIALLIIVSHLIWLLYPGLLLI
ncbi:MAG: hypothetical protein VB084_03065 [Syntrophomonadaceae bacterium]|nr:hypothetical protein [Syntrophomonadaceae bacterium]